MAQVLELTIFVIGGCYLWLLDNCGTASLYRFCIRDKAFTIQVGVNEVGWLAVDIAFLLV